MGTFNRSLNALFKTKCWLSHYEPSYKKKIISVKIFSGPSMHCLMPIVFMFFIHLDSAYHHKSIRGIEDERLDDSPCFNHTARMRNTLYVQCMVLTDDFHTVPNSHASGKHWCFQTLTVCSQKYYSQWKLPNCGDEMVREVHLKFKDCWLESPTSNVPLRYSEQGTTRQVLN